MYQFDPTYADTDGDGFMDNVDRALGDMVVKISITHFTPLETLWTPWPIGNNNPMAFFTISVDNYYSTTTVGTTVGSTTIITDRSYYVDVYDSNTSMTAAIAAWAANPSGGWPISDMRFDISSDPNQVSVSPTFSLTGQPNVIVSYSYTGDAAGDCDASITVTFEKIVLQKTPTIVVNGTKDGEEYGLYDEGGNLRYSADEQAYLIYLNCTSSSAHFAVGLNTIILPRSVAVESKLNDVLGGIASPVGTPLQGATFYGYDGSTSSAHVIAVISNTVTGTQADTLLQMITQNASDAQIGVYRAVSSAELYLLHLPTDVLTGVPLQGFQNSETGRSPSIWQETFFTTIVNAACFMFHALINLPSFLIDLAVSIVLFAIEKLGEIASVVAQAIQDAVDAIVDAFNAFVQWAIEFIQNTLNAVFGPIINAIKNAVDAYNFGLASVLAAAIGEYNQTGSVSPSTIGQFGSALRGDLFWILFGVTIAINVALIILTVVTSVFSFLLNMVIGLVITIIVAQAFSAQQTHSSTSVTSESAPEGVIDTEEFESEINQSGVNTQGTDWGVVWGAFGCLASMFALMVGYGAWHDGGLSKLGRLGLVVGCLSLAVVSCSLAFSGLVGLFMSIASLTMGAISLGLTIMDMFETEPLALASALFSIVVAGIALVISGVGIYLSYVHLTEQRT